METGSKLLFSFTKRNLGEGILFEDPAVLPLLLLSLPFSLLLFTPVLHYFLDALGKLGFSAQAVDKDGAALQQ